MYEPLTEDVGIPYTVCIYSIGTDPTVPSVRNKPVLRTYLRQQLPVQILQLQQ